MEKLSLLLTLVLPLLLAVAAAQDVRRYQIDNWLSVALLAGFPVAALLTGQPGAALWGGLATAAIVFAAGFGLWLLGAAGGGDVKLIAAAAAWFGWPLTAPFLFATALAGGLLAVGLIVTRRSLAWAGIAPKGPLAQLCDQRRGIPYGMAVALGGAWCYPLLLAAWR